MISIRATGKGESQTSVRGTTVCDVRLLWSQRIIELAMTGISRNNIEVLQTHAVMFNGNALLILSLEGVSEETNSKVHSRGPHAISVRRVVRMNLGQFGSSQRTETRS